jgi:hypothetical protein
MKTLAIEWRHLESRGRTCDRCSDTGQAVRAVVADLREEFARAGVAVSFTEAVLGADRVSESNQVRFNGVPLEDLIPGARAGESPCCSCTELLDVGTSCRTVEVGPRTYDAVPAELIRQAARRAVGLS